MSVLRNLQYGPLKLHLQSPSCETRGVLELGMSKFMVVFPAHKLDSGFFGVEGQSQQLANYKMDYPLCSAGSNTKRQLPSHRAGTHSFL